MTFRFVHTADWQIGKPFRNFPSDLAGELAAARFASLSKIADIARAQGAAHVLVAGDVFDSETLPNLIVRKALERLAAESAITWLLLPGNHDPARAGGIWDRIQRLGVPGNVVPLLTTEPYAVSADAIILPAPLTSKNPGRDPTAWMDSCATPAGVARIGLAHGSIQGFGSDGESAVLIARDRAVTANLAYLALGDWHGLKKVSDSTWYSGTPEPDRYPDNEPGSVLAVTVDGPRAVKVDVVASAHFRWAKVDTTLRSFADLEASGREMIARASEPSRLLVRLALSGSLSLAEHGQIEAWRETLAARLAHLDLDRSALAARPASSDLEILGGEGPLVDAARQLTALAADLTNPERAAAELALIRLYGFAAEAAREAGL